jgi:anti-sigma factor RsiW
MKDHSTRFQRNSHRDCWDLLPWLVNDTLSDAQKQRLELHLTDCADCRREASEQKAVREHLQREDSVLYAPQASLQKLLNRIDAGDSLPQPEVRRSFGSSRTMKLLAATFVIGAVSFIAVDSVSSWRLREEPRYSTLTSKPEVVVNVPAARVVFAPAMSLAQLSELLRASGAQVVTGPTDAGVYTLVFASPQGTTGAAVGQEAMEQQVSVAVQELRKNPNVLFAELVSAADTRTVQRP